MNLYVMFARFLTVESRFFASLRNNKQLDSVKARKVRCYPSVITNEVAVDTICYETSTIVVQNRKEKIFIFVNLCNLLFIRNELFVENIFFL